MSLQRLCTSKLRDNSQFKTVRFIEADGKALMLFLELLRLGYSADDIRSYAERVGRMSAR